MIIIVLWAIHVRHALIGFPQTISFIQTTPEHFRSDMLLERQPIVMDCNDAVAKMHDEAMFRYMYAYSTQKPFCSAVCKVDSAFVTLANVHENDTVSVNIVHPKHRHLNSAQSNQLEGQYVQVNLPPNHVLILPFLWTYQASSGGNVVSMQYWDVTRLLTRFLT